MSCAQNPGTYLGARYRRIAARRGPQKANVAIQHSMLIAIWHMGTNGCLYGDPGADYFHRLDPDRAKKRAIPTRSHGLSRHPDPRQLITDAGEIFASETFGSRWFHYRTQPTRRFRALPRGCVSEDT
jgi:hypothetical protein